MKNKLKKSLVAHYTFSLLSYFIANEGFDEKDFNGNALTVNLPT